MRGPVVSPVLIRHLVQDRDIGSLLLTASSPNKVRQSDIKTVSKRHCDISRMACSIADSDSLVLTGGWGGAGFMPTSLVVRYGLDGRRREEADLPQLNTGRRGHGCAGFDSDRDRVGISYFTLVMGSFNLPDNNIKKTGLVRCTW